MEKKEIISFGGGCFWGVEHAFKQLEGVTNTQVGYQGGSTKDPTYREVCSKTTGHAEVVQVEFNPDILSFERLLDAFFFMHDATQENRQGPDVGTQYRSCLYTSSEQRKKEALAYLEKNEDVIKARGEGKHVTTEVAINTEFYLAEIDHQDYLAHNPGGYCHIGFDVFSKLKQGQF